MKNKPSDSKADKGNQSNIGYENTEVRTDRDDMENTRAVPSKPTGKKEPKEKKSDSAGLRAESGKKTAAKKTGNLEKGT